MANSKIPSVQITDTFNTQRRRFNDLVDSVGDVSTLTTTATDITNAIKEHDAELGTITSGAMGTTASTVSTAIAELDGRLDSINTVELLSPRMSLSDGSAVNTIAGKLEVSDSADFKDNLSVQGNLAVGGNTTMSGTLTVDGEVTFKAGTNSNINLGDANTDNVVFNADVNSNIIPNTDNAYDLGSSTQEWRHVYVDGTVNADNVAADSATIGTLTVTGDTTLNNTITVQDSAYITGDLDLGSNLDVAGNVNVIGTVVSEGALTVEDSAYITSNLDVGGNVTVAGNTTFANTITVQDSAYITGNLDIGGNVTSTGTAFTISAETGSDDNVSLGDTITFEAGEGINTTVSNNNIKIDGELATSSNKGVASFSTDNFLVSSGVVTIKDDGVALGTETTGNYVATIAGTTNEIEVSGSGSETAAVTIGLPDDVTITGDLDVGGVATLDSVNLTGLLAVTGDLTVSNDFTVSGDFVVQGETRNASSYLIVNDGVAVSNSNRAGLAVDRPGADSAVVQWNEANDYWEAGLTTDLNRLALQNDSATFTNIYQTGTGATRIPAGTTGERPSAKQGQIRYNTSLSAFEGYSGTNWGSLGGLVDVDQDTYVVAERAAGTDSDTLQFYAGGTLKATIANRGLTVGRMIIDSGGIDTVDGGKIQLLADSGADGPPEIQLSSLNSAVDAGTIKLLAAGDINIESFDDIVLETDALYVGDNSKSSDRGFIITTDANGGTIRTHTSDSSSYNTRPQIDFFDPSSAQNFADGGNKITYTADSHRFYLGGIHVRDEKGSGSRFDQDLKVEGTLTIDNPLKSNATSIVLHDNFTGTPPNLGAGGTHYSSEIQVERGTKDNAKLKWNEVGDYWEASDDGDATLTESRIITTGFLNVTDALSYNSSTATLGHADTSSALSSNNSGRTYIQDVSIDSYGHVTGFATATETFTYSLPEATSTVRGGIELFSNTDQSEPANSVTSTANRTYGIQLNSSGQAVVNVPWQDNDTVYSLPLSANGTRGGIQVGYSENGKNYPVELSSEKAFVNVPWTDTTYSAGTDLDLSGTTFSLESELNSVNSIMGPDNDNLVIASHASLKLYSGHNGTPQGYNTMFLHAANYQFGFGTDNTNKFGIYEDTSLGGPQLTTTQSGDNLAIDAGGDIYLRPVGDNVFMQGTTSSEQLNFDLSNTEQSITSSDGLKLEAGGQMYLKATAGQIVIQSPTVTTASVPMALSFRNNDTSPADNMDLGFVAFQGEDTASDIDNTYARIRAQAPDVTSSSKHGRILLEVQENTSGSSANAVIADFNGNGNTVINAGNNGVVQLGSSTRNTDVLGGLMVGQSGNAANDEIRCVGDITAFYSSDRTLKENIVEIDNAMDKITAIRGVYFDWTDEHIEKRGGEDGYWVQKHDVGVIAQEVEEVLPEVVKDRDDGTKAVDYQKMVALLIEGMKEQQIQIDDLKEEIRLMKE